jgi:hypothetical protein
MDEVEIAQRIGRRLRWGAWTAVAAGFLLAVFTELPFLQVLALPLFLVVLPAMALAQAPFLHLLHFERIPAYLGSGLTILFMGGAAMLLGVLGPGVEAVGIRELPVVAFLLWTGGLTLAALAVSLAFRPLEERIWLRSRENTLQEEGLVDALLPRTGEERRLFAGLSLAAGWGEEMAYRGYVPAVLVLAGVTPWGAMAVGAGAFGILHAYQGPVGVVRTGLLGMLFGVPVILTGSLFPSMVSHALVDLVLGLVIGPRLLDREREGQPDPAPQADESSPSDPPTNP